MVSKGLRCLLLFALSVSLCSGCRSNKFAYSDPAPRPSATSLAVREEHSSVAPALSEEVAQTPAAASYSALANSTAYEPQDFSPRSNSSSIGCTSGCCAH